MKRIKVFASLDHYRTSFEEILDLEMPDPTGKTCKERTFEIRLAKFVFARYLRVEIPEIYHSYGDLTYIGVKKSKLIIITHKSDR